jgi:hypothetical protein
MSVRTASISDEDGGDAGGDQPAAAEAHAFLENWADPRVRMELRARIERLTVRYMVALAEGKLPSLSVRRTAAVRAAASAAIACVQSIL